MKSPVRKPAPPQVRDAAVRVRFPPGVGPASPVFVTTYADLRDALLSAGKPV